MVILDKEYTVKLRKPHAKQQAFIESLAARKVVKAGRRSGKTVGVAVLAVQRFLAGERVLYTSPTFDQLSAFWFEAKHALYPLIDAGIVYLNETQHIIEFPGTKQRLKAKSAYNADTLRGDYCSLLIMDEYQLTDETMWHLVGAPMLIDTGGSAVFLFTPPSLHSRSMSKARDKRHAAKLYKEADKPGWARFHFTSFDNPHVSQEAIESIKADMTSLAYRQEILAEDVEEAPGALWKLANLDVYRVDKAPENFVKIVVAIDVALTSTDQSDETGIIVAGRTSKGEGYILEDISGRYTPDEWARIVVRVFRKWKADRLVAESNAGGEMISHTVHTVDGGVAVKLIHATRGKQLRAEPIAALYEQGKIHHIGYFPALEDELISWEPLSGYRSPNRLDAMVYALIELFPSTGSVRIFA